MERLSDLWEADLFGRPQVRFRERRVSHFHTRQTALLFTYLAMYPRRHPRDEIVDLLWPDAEPAAGRPRLSLAIWRLRQTLNELCPGSGREIVISDRNTVSIDPARMTSDVARFRQLLQHAARGQETKGQEAKPDDATRVEALEQAVAVYGDSGGFLPGFYDGWVLSERQGLLTDYLAALEALAGQSEKAGEWARAERAVAADPLLEASHHTLIRVLAAGGQTAAAQRQYSTLAQLLARELNAEPSAATRALMAKVQEIVDATPAPLRSAAHTPSSRVAPLPLPLTTFHGRETLLRDLGVLLGDPATRLVTLLGAGGVGKTRLALELARGAAWQGAEPGVAFVPMAGIAEPRLIAESIADVLAPPSQALPLERIAGALTAAPDASLFLLVLDNAEYQAEEVGAVAVDLLARIPRLRVLVTSQRSLGVSGENEVTLPPLELPHVGLDPSPVGRPECQSAEALENVPSVRLFLDRAQSVRPDFPRDAASLTSVARICERLEGLPLAIELCAGWAQTLGTGQMLEMLARRFELLVSRRTDVPARHRTLHAAIDYGYVQLSETMQQFFLQLAVFRSGWTLGAAADVCTGGSTPRVLTMLAQMRERSLIVADETPAGGGMRYRMLESLRDFASGQCTPAQVQQYAEAHAAYFAHFVQETATRMRGEEDALWTARLEDEMENIRAALKHLTAGRDVEPAWTFTAAVADAWTTHSHARETRQWTARSLAMEDTPLSGDLPNTAERGARLLHLRARLLTDQARALAQLSDYTDWATSAEQALAIWRELGDNGGIAECLREMAAIALHNDNFDRAQALLAEALPLARTLSNVS